MSPPSQARGATRRGSRRRRRMPALSWASFDRWLDRLVTVAVATAVVVGITALVLSLVVGR